MHNTSGLEKKVSNGEIESSTDSIFTCQQLTLPERAETMRGGGVFAPNPHPARKAMRVVHRHILAQND
jgi:hypothetical protein